DFLNWRLPRRESSEGKRSCSWAPPASTAFHPADFRRSITGSAHLHSDFFPFAAVIVIYYHPVVTPLRAVGWLIAVLLAASITPAFQGPLLLSRPPASPAPGDALPVNIRVDI